MDIIYKIRTQQEHLSPIQLKIVDAILDDIAFAASASIDVLAQKAGVSAAALTRFAKALGYANIRDLRMDLAQANMVGTRFLKQTPNDTAPTNENPAFYGTMLADIEQSLQEHFAQFDEAIFKSATQLINQAQRIYIFGMGSYSSMFSDEFQHRLNRLGYVGTAYHDPFLMRMVAATLNAHDTIVVMSVSGVMPELNAATQLAKDYGAKIIAITRPHTSLSDTADVALPLLLNENSFIYAPTAIRYSLMLVMDILLTELALSATEEHRETLRRVKLVLDDYRPPGEDWLPLGD